MDKLLIRGGRKLRGEVLISGAKNAALPELCAALLTDQPVTLHNVPRLKDVATMLKLVHNMGVTAERDDNGTVRIDARSLEVPEAPYELVKTMRASVLALGPLLARFGRAKVSLPGGCQIGSRPVDQHLKGLEALGATISVQRGYIVAECKRLRGNEVVFDIPTVTGTENLMMAAALAKGRTTLVNCAREPEVEELGRVLNKMGAIVDGAGTDVIHIEGKDELEPFDHAIISDRIEAGTYMVAVAAAGGDVLLENAPLEDLEAVIAKLRQCGVEIGREGNAVRVRRGDKPLRAVDITTAPHPGFPTDMQAQLMVLMLLAHGTSRIVETIFENRFMHVPE